MNVVDAIGNTPLVELKSGIFAKLEYFNPTGSIKDRTAFGMLKSAMDKHLVKDKGIVEPTSGNTGISLAFLGAYFGIPVTIVMPENFSAQRIAIMESFGAKVLLTSADGGMRESVELAKKLESEGYLLLDQFSNPANPKIHELTTAVEIERQIDVDVVICGIGTGGTITGIAKRLKKTKPETVIVGIEPASSPFLTKGRTGRHKIQGIGAGFVPKVLDLSLIDRIVTVNDEDALLYNEKLRKEEGIFAGISSGAAYFVALKMKDEFKGKKVVAIFPDSMDRYI